MAYLVFIYVYLPPPPHHTHKKKKFSAQINNFHEKNYQCNMWVCCSVSIVCLLHSYEPDYWHVDIPLYITFWNCTHCVSWLYIQFKSTKLIYSICLLFTSLVQRVGSASKGYNKVLKTHVSSMNIWQTRRDENNSMCLFMHRKSGVPDDGVWTAPKLVRLGKWIKDKLNIRSWCF